MLQKNGISNNRRGTDKGMEHLYSHWELQWTREEDMRMIFYCGSTTDGTLRRRVIARYAVMEGGFCTEFAMRGMRVVDHS